MNLHSLKILPGRVKSCFGKMSSLYKSCSAVVVLFFVVFVVVTIVLFYFCVLLSSISLWMRTKTQISNFPKCYVVARQSNEKLVLKRLIRNMAQMLTVSLAVLDDASKIMKSVLFLMHETNDFFFNYKTVLFLD
jgi:hypothetical protein